MERTWHFDCDFKINLDLNITGKLDNGYHSLDSLFLRLPGGDHLTLQLVSDKSNLLDAELKRYLNDDTYLQNYTLQIISKRDLLGNLVLSQAVLADLQQNVANNLVSKAWRYLANILIHSLLVCLPEFKSYARLIVKHLRVEQLESSINLQHYWRQLKDSTLKKYLIFLCFGNWQFSLLKAIPVQTGLGAGSFDAATVWRLLFQVFADELTNDMLPLQLEDFVACFNMADIAYNLGADIPFALQFNSKIARVLGIGEKINRLDSYQKPSFILVKPNLSVDTKQAFMAYDLATANKQTANITSTSNSAPDTVFNLWRQADYCELAKYAGNSFYALAQQTNKKLADFRASLQLLGADFVSMSGSGSAFYLLYKEQANCLAAVYRLLNDTQSKGLVDELAWLSLVMCC